MKRNFTPLASLLLVAFLATSAFAADSTARAGKMWQRMVTRLNLSADQQNQIRPTFDAERQAMRDRYTAYQNELKSVLTPDQMAQLEKNKADRKACRKSHTHFDGRAAWKSLNLTPEQKAQLKAFHQQNRPQIKAERKQYIAQVESALNADQKARFEKMMSHGRHGHRNNPAEDGNGTPSQQPQ